MDAWNYTAHRITGVGLTVLGLAVLTGCIEFGLDPIEPNHDPTQRVTVTESFFSYRPSTDLLPGRNTVTVVARTAATPAAT